MKMLYDSMFFGVMLSLVAYSIGVIIKQKLKLALFNPLLISIGLIIAFWRFLEWNMIHIIKVPPLLAIC